MSISNSLIFAAMGLYLVSSVAVCPFACGSNGTGPERYPVDTGGDVSSDADVAGDAARGETGTEGDTGMTDAESSLDGGDCAEDETYLQDACIQCGPAGGCAEREARCVPTCGELADCTGDERAIPTQCRDGVCRHICS